jgi:ribosomal-protein-serine acetyltransferase
MLAGSVSLQISSYTRSGEIGYWIDGGFEGRGLASRAVAAVLDQAFGPLGLVASGIWCKSAGVGSSRGV